MFLRLAMLAPLALAAALPAQLTPTKPVKPTTPVVPTQEPTTAERLDILVKEKARLQREIKFATERVQQAKGLLSSKLTRSKPVFKAIDAGKPASAIPIPPKQVQRKFAQIGTVDQMNYGGNTMMVMVEDRAISQASFDSVMNYLGESGNQGTENLHAQRVLFDLIRIEAVASEFIENEGEVQLSENLNLLETGAKSFAAAAAEFGTVAGANEDGAVDVSRNSILGPYFEYVAFSTPVGKTSRPFRTTSGYAVIKVDSLEKGAQAGLDKVKAHVVQFAYSAEKKMMQKAQFKVNSGQINVRVRDQQVLDMLPALFKPAAPRQTPLQRMQQQIVMAEEQLSEIGDTNSEKSEALNAQLTQMRERMKLMQQQAQQPAGSSAPSDQLKKAKIEKESDKVAPLMKAPVKKAVPLMKAPVKKAVPLMKAPVKKAV
ncbi:MAG: hypothetical protein ACI9SE_000674, partial [Neolewinella sp.]